MNQHMQKTKMVILSLFFSIVGVGFLFFESGALTPIVPQGPLESFMGSYVSLEGVVCRKFESKGNLFIVIRGDYEVEVPIFYGLKESLGRVPDLGDWVNVQGVLEEVPQEYLREYWPKFSLSVNEAYEIEVGEIHQAFLDKTYDYSLSRAGLVLCLEGKIELIEDGTAYVNGVGVPASEEMSIADRITGKVLVVENDHKLENIPIEMDLLPAEVVPLDNVVLQGESYRTRGTVEEMRPYYSGLLITLVEDGRSLEVYARNMAPIFFRDVICARGIFKEFRGRELLYVGSSLDIVVEERGIEDPVLAMSAGQRSLVVANVIGEDMVGKHRVVQLSVSGQAINCHLYCDELEDMEKMGRDLGLLEKGSVIVAYLEIIEKNGLIESKLIDFLPYYK